MIQILSACSTSLVDCCSEGGLSNILLIIKNCITIIQVIGPIVLVVSVSINIIQLMANPDDDKKKSSIFRKLIAALVIVFLPVVVDVTLSAVSTAGDANTYNITDCWTNMKTIQEQMTTTNADDSTTDKDNGSELITPNCYQGGESDAKFGDCQ